MDDTRLLHVRIPAHLLIALDEIKKDRSRSDVVTEAVEQFVERHRLLETLKTGAGSLTPEAHRVWSSDQSVDQWVKERRAEYEGRTAGSHDRLRVSPYPICSKPLTLKSTI